MLAMSNGMGMLNKAGVPIAVAGPICKAGYPQSSNGWCYDSLADWMAYGNLPEYQNTTNPAPVSAQQAALDNARAAGLTPLRTAYVLAASIPTAASPGLTITPTVTLKPVALPPAPVVVPYPTVPVPVVKPTSITPVPVVSKPIAPIVTAPTSVTPVVVKTTTPAMTTPTYNNAAILTAQATKVVTPASTTTPPANSTSVSVNASNPSAPSVNTAVSTSVQASPNTTVNPSATTNAANGGSDDMGIPSFSLPNLAFGSFTSEQVWIGLGVAGAILLIMSMQSKGRR